MDLLSREALTIYAPITAPGEAGIGVIRVSGSAALSVVSKLAGFLPGACQSHSVYYGKLKSSQGEALDEVLVSYFAPGKSFTGEETLEISCHGNPIVLSRVMKELSLAGAQAAEPGEFTFRAVLRGRIDLVQAEAILSLIQSRSEASARVSLRQIEGDLSKKIREIEDDLTWVLANIEAGIDFSTEDIEVLDRKIITDRVSGAVRSAQQLAGTFYRSRPLVEGFRVAILGPPNAGKSSLLNRLAGSERAIVTEIPGTTRDVVEARIALNGLDVILVDTAGLRETQDRIEKLGIERALQAARNSDLILYVVDSEIGLSLEDRDALALVGQTPTLVVFNKADKIQIALDLPKEALLASASTGQGVSELLNRISQSAPQPLGEEAVVVVRQRHHERLTEIQEKATKGLELLQENASLEFVALELREALVATYDLLGKRLDDQVMDRVFKEFCIGK